MEGMLKVYNCCILAGIALPLLGLLLSGIGNVFDLDFDFDGDTSFDTPFPITPMVLAFAAVVFGAVGRMCMNRAGISAGAGIAVAAASALLGGALLSRFVVRPLKRNRAEALSIENLPGCKGRMQLEARADFIGTVAVESSIGSIVTYSAKPVEGIACIPIGVQVRIVQVDCKRQLCFVTPLDAAEGSSAGKQAGGLSGFAGQ